MEARGQEAADEPELEISAQSELEPKVAQISPKSREISEEEIFLATLLNASRCFLRGLNKLASKTLAKGSS